VHVDIKALNELERVKEIPAAVVVAAIEDALLKAYEHTQGHRPGARVEIDRKSGAVRVLVPVTDDDGNVVGESDDTPADFGRVAATTARQVILQRLADAEEEVTYGSFVSLPRQLVSGVIQQGRDARTVYVDLGKVEAVIPLSEQVPGEVYKHGERIRAYVLEVRKGQRGGPQVTLSRSHPDLVRRLFALNVPEIEDGSVEIVSIAREAGHRSKVSVRSRVPGVNAKGACIGELGSRVREVVAELRGEQIDIIDWSDDPATYVANALSPARVLSVRVIDPEVRQARVIVPDFQLSLAIGKEGQNARLAHRLTGWRIDIRPDTAADPADLVDERGTTRPNPSADGGRYGDRRWSPRSDGGRSGYPAGGRPGRPTRDSSGPQPGRRTW
jgi:N utilization substance protein A